MTFEEFEQLPDEAHQLELLEGELVRMPPPDADHMEACENLYNLLLPAVNNLRESGRAVGKLHIEMGYLMSSKRSWLRPDLGITHPEQRRAKFYVGSPMVAIEVVSTYDQATDLEEKVRVFLENGALEVWTIYPKLRHALVHAPDSVRREAWGFRSPLLPGVEIPFEAFL